MSITAIKSDPPQSEIVREPLLKIQEELLERLRALPSMGMVPPIDIDKTTAQAEEREVEGTLRRLLTGE